jgi:hypothetical protein
MNALFQELQTMRARNPESCAIVFSQFTSFLTMLQTPLKNLGYDFVRYLSLPPYLFLTTYFAPILTLLLFLDWTEQCPSIKEAKC